MLSTVLGLQLIDTLLLLVWIQKSSSGVDTLLVRSAGIYNIALMVLIEALRRLDGHQGFVKGVCWDPVGEYLATQSDDKTMKIWRTTDWELEETISEPFKDSPGSTFFNRLRLAHPFLS